MPHFVNGKPIPVVGDDKQNLEAYKKAQMDKLKANPEPKPASPPVAVIKPEVKPAPKKRGRKNKNA